MDALQRLSRWVDENRDVVFDILRVYLGVGLFARGVLFIATPEAYLELVSAAAPAWLTSAGLMYFVAAVHLVGGAMLAAGFMTRLAALSQVPILFGAVFAAQFQGGLFTASQSLEFALLVLVLLGLVFLHGSGRWSVDYYRTSGPRFFVDVNERLDDYGHVAWELLRVYLGVGLFVRGALFIADTTAFTDLLGGAETAWMTSMIMVHYVALAHLVGGFMMAVGLLTRVATLVQIPILAGAVFLVHFQGGLIASSQSLEFSSLVLVLLGLLFLYGSGRWSADYYIFQREAPDAELAGIEARRAARAAEPHHTEAPAPEALLQPEAYHAAEGLRCPIAETCPVVESGSIDVARHHPWVQAKARYSALGALYFFGGITAPPKEVLFKCERCGQVIDRSKEAEVLAEFRYP